MTMKYNKLSHCILVSLFLSITAASLCSCNENPMSAMASEVSGVPQKKKTGHSINTFSDVYGVVVSKKEAENSESAGTTPKKTVITENKIDLFVNSDGGFGEVTVNDEWRGQGSVVWEDQKPLSSTELKLKIEKKRLQDCKNSLGNCEKKLDNCEIKLEVLRDKLSFCQNETKLYEKASEE